MKVILIYDTLLILDDEINYIWRRFGVGSVAYLLTRYCIILASILAVAFEKFSLDTAVSVLKVFKSFNTPLLDN